MKPELKSYEILPCGAKSLQQGSQAMSGAYSLDSVRTPAYCGSATTVHVVDDDPGVRRSLQFLLESYWFNVRTYAHAWALLDSDRSTSGCVLTDWLMPEYDGLQLQTTLAERGSRLPVIVISGHGDVPLVARAMKAGAVDFLEKPCGENEIIEAVGRALEKNKRSLEAEASSAAASLLVDRLTPREREVLDLLVLGKSSKEIGRLLGASPRTVDVHRAHLIQKVEAKTLPDLVHLVIAANLHHAMT